MAGPHHFGDPVGSVVFSQGAQPLLSGLAAFPFRCWSQFPTRSLTTGWKRL